MAGIRDRHSEIYIGFRLLLLSQKVLYLSPSVLNRQYNLPRPNFPYRSTIQHGSGRHKPYLKTRLMLHHIYQMFPLCYYTTCYTPTSLLGDIARNKTDSRLGNCCINNGGELDNFGIQICVSLTTDRPMAAGERIINCSNASQSINKLVYIQCNK